MKGGEGEMPLPRTAGCSSRFSNRHRAAMRFCALQKSATTLCTPRRWLIRASVSFRSETSGCRRLNHGGHRAHRRNTWLIRNACA